MAAAQEDVRLWLGEPDLTAFPQVTIPLRTADPQGAHLTDLSSLSLRENSIPLDFEVTAVPTGIDVIFVIDANADFGTEDDNDGQTRAAKVVESINQFAGRFMSRDGLDRVSVIVPDELNENGRFLVEDSSNPNAFAQSITAYSPETLAETPLQAMLKLAVNQALLNEDGRYQAILLFTDGGRIHRQLAFDEIVEQAEAANVAIFAAILGARADQNEIDNVSRLTEPTGGGYVHMPTGNDGQAIYLIWQGQANQTRLVYQSLQSRSGQYPITVNLGGARAMSELVLSLGAPEVTIQLPVTEIRRVGGSYDTPLAALEPAMVEVAARVSWPDDLPRPLTAVALQVNGQDGQTVTVAEIQPDDQGLVVLSWDVQLLRAGPYQLVVQVADGLGYTAESDPLIVNIIVERPDPPTPTPPPTAVPVTAVPEPVPVLSADRLWLALGISLLVGLAAAVMFWRRWRQAKAKAVEKEGEEAAARLATQLAEEPPPADTTNLLAAFLEFVDDGSRLLVEGENVILGRDEAVAQIVLDQPGVARLHARIRRRDGRYWLYDEGSAGGTTLNFERLGLAPRELREGDQIQIGRLRLRFVLDLPPDEEE